MRLIDADALPRCWQPDCNGNRRFVDTKDVDAAPTVCCADCSHADVATKRHLCSRCYCGSNFKAKP